MLRFLTTPWYRLPAGVVLALLVSGVVAPQKARASCGDYVTVQGQSGHNNMHPRPASKPSPSAPDPVQAPCRGPGCSGNPAPASLPISTISHNTYDQWDCMFTLTGLSGGDGQALVLCEEGRQRIHRVCPIYHPPRAV